MLIYRIKAKTRRQSVALFNLRWNVDIERPIFFLPFLRMSANNHESPTTINFGVTNTF